MDIQRLLSTTLAIQAIPAPPFGEAKRAAFILDAFSEIGLAQAELDHAGNVLGCVPGGSPPPLVVSAHLDSVFPAQEVIPASLSEGRLVGPGIGDNALGVAVLTELGRDLLEHPPGCPVWLVANVGEEGLGNLRGMRAVLDRFSGYVRGYLVLEGMALGHVYHRALPSERFRIEVETPGGHSWIHYGRPSATHLLIEALHRLLSLPLPQEPRSSFNIGSLRGGTGVNRLAEQAACEIEFRSEAPGTLHGLVLEMERRVDPHQTSAEVVRLVHLGSRPAGELSADHPLVQAAIQATRHSTGVAPDLSAGSTDASLPISLGLPAVCIGITRGGRAHSMDEFIEISSIAPGYEAVLGTVRLACRLAGAA